MSGVPGGGSRRPTPTASLLCSGARVFRRSLGFLSSFPLPGSGASLLLSALLIPISNKRICRQDRGARRAPACPPRESHTPTSHSATARHSSPAHTSPHLLTASEVLAADLAPWRQSRVVAVPGREDWRGSGRLGVSLRPAEAPRAWVRM